MLTERELRTAFLATNTAEPLSEGWPGLERFAREVERLAQIKTVKKLVQIKISGYYCVICMRFLPTEDGVITHDAIPHPYDMRFDEKPM